MTRIDFLWKEWIYKAPAGPWITLSRAKYQPRILGSHEVKYFLPPCLTVVIMSIQEFDFPCEYDLSFKYQQYWFAIFCTAYIIEGLVHIYLRWFKLLMGFFCILNLETRYLYSLDQMEELFWNRECKRSLSRIMGSDFSTKLSYKRFCNMSLVNWKITMSWQPYRPVCKHKFVRCGWVEKLKHSIYWG